MTDETQGAVEVAKTAVTSLAQLQKQQVYDVDVPQADGTFLTFPMRALKQSEWLKIGRDVPNPAPKSYGGVNGVTYDTADPDYRAKLNEAEYERNIRRLVASLLIDIPGIDLAAKAQTLLSELDTDVLGGLFSGFWKINRDKGADINSREAAFQR